MEAKNMHKRLHSNEIIDKSKKYYSVKYAINNKLCPNKTPPNRIQNFYSSEHRKQCENKTSHEDSVLIDNNNVSDSDVGANCLPAEDKGNKNEKSFVSKSQIKSNVTNLKPRNLQINHLKCLLNDETKMDLLLSLQKDQIKLTGLLALSQNKTEDQEDKSFVMNGIEDVTNKLNLAFSSYEKKNSNRSLSESCSKDIVNQEYNKELAEKLCLSDERNLKDVLALEEDERTINKLLFLQQNVTDTRIPLTFFQQNEYSIFSDEVSSDVTKNTCSNTTKSLSQKMTDLRKSVKSKLDILYRLQLKEDTMKEHDTQYQVRNKISVDTDVNDLWLLQEAENNVDYLLFLQKNPDKVLRDETKNIVCKLEKLIEIVPAADIESEAKLLQCPPQTETETSELEVELSKMKTVYKYPEPTRISLSKIINDCQISELDCLMEIENPVLVFKPDDEVKEENKVLIFETDNKVKEENAIEVLVANLKNEVKEENILISETDDEDQIEMKALEKDMRTWHELYNLYEGEKVVNQLLFLQKVCTNENSSKSDFIDSKLNLVASEAVCI